jgi:glycerol uptake facilitator protein
MEDRGPSAYAAELLGTLLLVLFIGSVLSTAAGLGVTDWAVIGLLHVFVLGMLVATLGGTSGAHFNPAITIGLAAVRKIKPSDATIYVVVQLIGGLIGALIVKLIFKDEGHGSYGAATVSEKFLQGKNLSGLFVELVGTFGLVWAVMGAAVNVRAERAWAPWVIGGTLGAMVMCFGPLTGGSLNPARAFGPMIAAGGPDWSQFFVSYCIGPIAGGVLAAFAYTAIVLRQQEALFGGRLVDADVPPGRVAGEAAALETPGERPIDKLS